MYEKEAKQQEEKIEKMKAEDGENYAIKKQVKLPLIKNWDNSEGGRAGARALCSVTGACIYKKGNGCG